MLTSFFLAELGMEIYTIQMGKWRRAKELGIEFIDTTWRNGNPAFSPTKEIVHGIKYSGLTQEEYTRRYMEILDLKIDEHREEWKRVVHLDRVVVACMCRAGVFCHRHLLKGRLMNYARAMGLPVVDMGELI